VDVAPVAVADRDANWRVSKNRVQPLAAHTTERLSSLAVGDIHDPDHVARSRERTRAATAVAGHPRHRPVLLRETKLQLKTPPVQHCPPRVVHPLSILRVDRCLPLTTQTPVVVNPRQLTPATSHKDGLAIPPASQNARRSPLCHRGKPRPPIRALAHQRPPVAVTIRGLPAPPTPADISRPLPEDGAPEPSESPRSTFAINFWNVPTPTRDAQTVVVTSRWSGSVFGPSRGRMWDSCWSMTRVGLAVRQSWGETRSWRCSTTLWRAARIVARSSWSAVLGSGRRRCGTRLLGPLGPFGCGCGVAVERERGAPAVRRPATGRG
jgi:hypothetical protein